MKENFQKLSIAVVYGIFIRTKMIKYIFGNAILYALSSLFGKGCLIISTIIAAQKINVSELAVYSLSLVTYQAFLIVALSGLSNIAVKNISVLKGRKECIKHETFNLLILTVFFSFVSSVVCYYFMNDIISEKTVHTKEIAAFFSASVFLHTIIIVCQSILQGIGNFFQIFKINLLLFFLVLIPQLVFADSDFSFALVFMASNFILFMIALKSVCSSAGWVCRIEGRDLIVLSKDAFPVLLSTGIVPITLWYGTRYLAEYGELVESAIYSTAYQWRNLISFVPVVLTQVLLPKILSELKVERLHYYWRFNIFFTVAFSTVAAILGIFFAMLFVPSIYGEAFYNAGSVFSIIVLASCISAVNALFGTFLFANSNYWIMMFVNFLWAAVYLTLLVTYPGTADAKMLAEVLVISYLVHFIIQALVVLFLRQRRRKI